MVIFCFRRDLRLSDNTALYYALTSGKDVLPIFIFDKNILSELDTDDPRVTFISSSLQKIQRELKVLGKSLAVFYDEPLQVFEKLLAENHITQVYANRDYEPYATERDGAVSALLQKNSIELITFKDQVIFDQSEIVKDNGTPYVVYTPYMKKWKEKFSKELTRPYPSEAHLHKFGTHSYPFLDLNDIGFTASKIAVAPYNISGKLIDEYNFTRDFPALHGTSHIGVYIRFGVVSIREVMAAAAASTKPTYCNELIWREFFMQILWHFPYTVNAGFRSKYDEIVWRNDEKDFQKWCDGQTGYAMVDAGMRELNATGHMHNRVRMVVASFLCKHLLIDWRWGEAYFAQKLLDYELASNVGNWQWAAGSGVDAAPYFRIFNPDAQQKKFDKGLKYVRKWVPEFQSMDYKPMVDHKEARERALAVYGKALKD